MVLGSDFFPLKRPPRSFMWDFNLIIKKLCSFVFYATLLALVHNHQTKGFSLLQNYSRYQHNSTLDTNNSIFFESNVSRTDNLKLFQPWKYVYSNNTKKLKNFTKEKKYLNQSKLLNIYLLGNRIPPSKYLSRPQNDSNTNKPFTNHPSNEINSPKQIHLEKNIIKTIKNIHGPVQIQNVDVNDEKKITTETKCQMENVTICKKMQEFSEKISRKILNRNVKMNETFVKINASKPKSVTDEMGLIRGNSSVNKKCNNTNILEKITNPKINDENRFNDLEELIFINSSYINENLATKESILVRNNTPNIVINEIGRNRGISVIKNTILQKVKRGNILSRGLSNFRSDEQKFSDDNNNYSGRTSRIKSDKSVSTLLSPLDITPLLKKSRHKEFDKIKENKAPYKQAQESVGIKNTTEASVHLSITQGTSSQLTTETSVTTIQVPRLNESSSLVSDIDISYPKTLEYSLGTKSIVRKGDTGPFNELFTKTRVIKSNENINSFSVRDLVTDVPFHNQLETYSADEIKPKPLKVENLFFNDTRKPSNCDTLKYKGDKNGTGINLNCNDSLEITEHINSERVKNMTSLNHLKKYSETLSKSLNDIKKYQDVNETNEPSHYIVENHFLNSTFQNNTDPEKEQVTESVTSDPYYSGSTEPYNLDTWTNFDDNITYDTSDETFIFTNESTGNTTTESETNSTYSPYSDIIQTDTGGHVTESAPSVKLPRNYSVSVNEVENIVTLDHHPSTSRYSRIPNYDLTTVSGAGYESPHSSANSKSLNESEDRWQDPKVDVKPGIVAHVNGSMSVSRLNSSEDSDANWPVKLASVVEGDIILGGLMMVHSREDSVTCGPIMPQGGIQALEAMLYTLDRLNSNPYFMPNVTLGAHILDDCDKDTYGLEMAVDFIKGELFFIFLS